MESGLELLQIECVLAFFASSVRSSRGETRQDRLSYLLSDMSKFTLLSTNVNRFLSPMRSPVSGLLEYVRLAMQTFKVLGLQDTAVEDAPTLLVTREIEEHANVFHTLTDILNVYISTKMLGWDQIPFQIILLDDHPKGPLDVLWPAIAAAEGGIGTNNIGNINRKSGSCPLLTS